MSSPPPKISILLADDHPIVRTGLRALLEKEPDMRVVGEAGDGREAIEKVRDLSPDVLVVDISMPGLNGIEATRHITQTFPETRVIALSVHSSRQFIKDMFKAGAVGYVLKESVPEELTLALHAVARGEFFLSAVIAGKVINGFLETVPDDHDAADSADVTSNGTGPETIIRTKLYRPDVPPNHVYRSRLVDMLLNGRQKPLTLVSAPAGYGKSILVSSWLEKLDCPAAWLSLDAEDDVPRRFMTYLIAAIESILPDTLQSTKTFIEAIETPPVKGLAACLLHELGAIEKNFVLAIDDLHLLRNDFNRDLLNEILKHAPANCHMVLIGRIDPFLPINRMRAQSLVTEIRTKDLQFTPEETAAFLASAAGHEIDDGLATSWARKTEGWVTGLRLASLAFKGLGISKLPADLPNNAQYVLEYLFNEVFARQSETMRRYLLASAVLDRFCAPLCSALAAPPEEDATEGFSGWNFIAAIRMENLFAINLDTENRWYRYHALFHQLLKNQLGRSSGEADIAVLNSRASQWFADNGLIDEAIKHALRAADVPRAVRLLGQHRPLMLNRGRWFVLEKWLSMFPSGTLAQDPELLVTRMWVDYFRSQFGKLQTLVETCEALLGRDPEPTPLKGEIALFQSIAYFMRGDGPKCLAPIQQARKCIPSDHAAAKDLVGIYQALILQMNGRQRQAVRELSDLLLVPSHPFPRRIRTLIALVWLHLIAGELVTAQRYNRQLQDMARHRKDRTYLAWSHYVRGLIHFQRYEMEAATSHFDKAADWGYLILRRAMIDMLTGQALTHQASGRIDRADAALNRLWHFTRTQGSPDENAMVDACKLRLALMKGEPAKDSGGLIPEPPHGKAFMATWLEIPHITRCRALIAEGTPSGLQTSENHLRALLATNRRHHNTYQAIDIMALLVVCLSRQGRTEEALETLEEVLHLAEPGGWIRPFVEAGTPMTDLLVALRAKGVCLAYTEKILKACVPNQVVPVKAGGTPDSHTPNSLQPLFETLTNREMDVLEFLAKRWQNKEIADQLCVSPETVKSHLKNIYQKLDAPDRIKAVEKARRLGLLPPK